MKISELVKGAEVKIYSMSGELMREYEVKGESIEITRGNLQKGMYVYHVEEKGMITSRGNLMIGAI